MNQIKNGNRVVVIAGAAPASANANYRKHPEQRPTARRIVVIRNGKSVGNGRGR